VPTYGDKSNDEKLALFEDFKTTYGRKYASTDEESAKYVNFVDFLDTIDERNAAEVDGGATHGITKYADLSTEEFEGMFLTLEYKDPSTMTGMKDWTEDPNYYEDGGRRRRRRRAAAAGPSGPSGPPGPSVSDPTAEPTAEPSAAPSEPLSDEPSAVPTPAPSAEPSSSASGLVDWTGTLTTSVNDQGYCGSCWAFSGGQQMESAGIEAGISTTTEKLSYQELVSCDTYSNGCSGGNPYYAYYWVYCNGGIDSDQEYPYDQATYDSGNSGTCSTKDNYVLTVTGFYYMGGATGSDLQTYVENTGPLSVLVDASTWSSYTGGIVTSSACGTGVNHAVNINGFNPDGDMDYWIVRNSWGTDWGEDGYIYLEMEGNTCNIQCFPTYASVGSV
jgi:hypothetical protein